MNALVKIFGQSFLIAEQCDKNELNSDKLLRKGVNKGAFTTSPSVCTLFICIIHSISHYGDVIMGAITSQITSLTIVYSTVYSDADQRKHQSSASLAFVQGIHRGPVNSPHKWPVTRKMLPFDDVIMRCVVAAHHRFVGRPVSHEVINVGADRCVRVILSGLRKYQ